MPYRALALALCLAAPLEAFAAGEGGGIRDGSYHRRPFQLSFFAYAPYAPYYVPGPYGFGLASRFAIPIASQGFLPPLNDSFELEVGGNFYSDVQTGTHFVVAPTVEVRWTFHLTSHFSAYPKLGFGWSFPLDGRQRPRPYPIAAAGILYEVIDWFYLRAEAGYPGLLLGLAFAF